VIQVESKEDMFYVYVFVQSMDPSYFNNLVSLLHNLQESPTITTSLTCLWEIF
jgi:hypothetical protein